MRVNAEYFFKVLIKTLFFFFSFTKTPNQPAKSYNDLKKKKKYNSSSPLEIRNNMHIALRQPHKD